MEFKAACVGAIEALMEKYGAVKVTPMGGSIVVDIETPIKASDIRVCITGLDSGRRASCYVTLGGDSGRESEYTPKPRPIRGVDDVLTEVMFADLVYGG